MEIVRLNVKKDRIIHCKNPFGEEYNDYLYKNDYIFEVGKTYGVICEHGEGGESLSLLLSSEKELVSEEILIDNGCLSSVEEIGWYVGKSIYSNSILNKEITQKKSIEMAIHKYRRYDNISDIINDFHLSDNKLDYSFSNNTEWERWRTSFALGYASNKKIFCFPWMNSLQFYDCMYNSSVYRFFDKIKEEKGIVILPTSKKKNVVGLVDDIIVINNPRFDRSFTDIDTAANS